MEWNTNTQLSLDFLLRNLLYRQRDSDLHGYNRASIISIIIQLMYNVKYAELIKTY